ncbi:hypothetical protein ABZP36_014518 [Zizania latifolia]
MVDLSTGDEGMECGGHDTRKRQEGGGVPAAGAGSIRSSGTMPIVSIHALRACNSMWSWYPSGASATISEHKSVLASRSEKICWG